MNDTNQNDNLINAPAEVQKPSPEKKHIYYNESALTSPKKKNHGIIIGIFILLIVMLLVGIIGFAWNMEKEMEKNGKHQAEEFWRGAISMVKDKIDTEDSQLEKFSENNEQKFLFYHDAETNVFVSVPENYILIGDYGEYDDYSIENTSSIMYDMVTDYDMATDNIKNVIHVCAEYKLSADSDKEYAIVKNRAQEVVKEGITLSKNRDNGKALVYILPGMRESCAVIHTTEGQEAVIVLTCTTAHESDVDLEKVVTDVFNTISYEFDLQMNE